MKRSGALARVPGTIAYRNGSSRFHSRGEETRTSGARGSRWRATGRSSAGTGVAATLIHMVRCSLCARVMTIHRQYTNSRGNTSGVLSEQGSPETLGREGGNWLGGDQLSASEDPCHRIAIDLSTFTPSCGRRTTKQQAPEWVAGGKSDDKRIGGTPSGWCGGGRCPRV